MEKNTRASEALKGYKINKGVHKPKGQNEYHIHAEKDGEKIHATGKGVWEAFKNLLDR